MAEPKNPALPKLRDWPMFRASRPRGGSRRATVLDGRPAPKIAELLVSRLQGTPSAKLAWLRAQQAAGKLDGDDPEEIAEAEATLAMLARLGGSKARKETRRHLDELLDDALGASFPASDPVSIGRFS